MPSSQKAKLHTRLKGIIDSFIRALHPKGYVCLFCGDELTEANREESICDKCREKLPYRVEQTCPVCGNYYSREGLCPKCRKAMPSFKKAYAPFDFSGNIRKMIIGYKDGGKPFLGEYIARYLVIFARAVEITADYITFIPSHPKTIRRRGFDHCLKVAKIVSEQLGIPLIEPLKRIKLNKDQTKLTTEERSTNVSKVFAKRDDFDFTAIQGKSILIIDDVMTTGATCSACSNILKRMGAETILILTFAR